MALSLRRRLFLGMVGLGTLPLVVALLVLAVQVRSTGSSAGRATLDQIAESGRRTVTALDTLALPESGRTALREHLETIGRSTSLARRAETLGRTAAGVLAVVVLVVSVLVVTLSLITARRLSTYTSRPVEELVRWVRRIERRDPLPAESDAHRHGAPEFDALRAALRQMAEVLGQARVRELEQERLTAFRETARQVAHEMRGPLTAARLAVEQLDPPANGAARAAVSALRDEVGRLERMAAEFSVFSRLPEGPTTEIDLDELLGSVLAGAVPATCPVTRPPLPSAGLSVRGRYEPLRRAFQNLVQNAVEATDDRGIVVETEARDEPTGGGIAVRVRDFGPGIPEDLRGRVFDPYVTTKPGGTGLGLALVRQTVLDHGGSVTIEGAPGGGTTFVVRLPTPGGAPARTGTGARSGVPQQDRA